MKIHLFHDWSKWEIKDEGEIMITDPLPTSQEDIGKKRQVGSWFDQRRTCKICNKIQKDFENFYL